ncbi:MAG: acyl-CoA dehydrogenase [Nevskiaceae bacterium]|nr:MAG: acyl-CoA dehydrogenase [Nevskiaceae bacterium]TBR71384.1 MAG: acyl-CoA dehydrogenase [Nevskiaceae bacterium]
MKFTFEPEQFAFRDAVRRFLVVEAVPEVLRAFWETQSGRSPEMRAKVTDQGLTALSVPEAFGGMGLNDLDWILILQELGYHGIPESLSDSAYLGVDILRNLPDGVALKKEWLERIAAGKARIAVGHPVNPFVADAAIADLLLLWHDDEVHATTPDAVKLTLQPSLDQSRRLYRVEWQPSAATRVCDAATGAPIWRDACDRAALSVASQLRGLAKRMLDLGVDYSAQRKQFGRPVGSFQALKHHLANVAVAVEFAGPVIHRAAYSMAHGHPQRAAHVSHARVVAGEAAWLAARNSMQAHGAMGYTWETDLQMFMKHAWALDSAWGTRAFHKSRVTAAVLADGMALGPGATFI